MRFLSLVLHMAQNKHGGNSRQWRVGSWRPGSGRLLSLRRGVGGLERSPEELEGSRCVAGIGEEIPVAAAGEKESLCIGPVGGGMEDVQVGGGNLLVGFAVDEEDGSVDAADAVSG